jgi:mycofactocin precursor peptide peptidase
MLLAMPLGACEQHGPHLPLDTDTRVAVALAERLAQGRPDVLVGPSIGIAASGEHQAFPGTLSVGTTVLATMLVEVVRSASWAAGVVVVNGHGGNLDALDQAHRVWQAENRAVMVWSPTLPDGGDAHAGWVETSVMLALAPHLVGEARPIGSTDPMSELWPTLRRHGVDAVSASGVLGDARRASAELGDSLLRTWTDDLIATVARRWPPVAR